MGIKQSLNDEFDDMFDDAFDIERIKKEMKNLSKQKDLQERTNKKIKEFMEYQAKNALKGSNDGEK